MKRILITGANSYIGDSVKRYLEKFPNDYKVDIIGTKGLVPLKDSFIGYDVVFNVAGVAHVRESRSNRSLYYEVNRDLVVNIAKKAKMAGVRQFVLLSSMSVYGKTTGHIRKTDIPLPNNAYGDSKYQADEEIKNISDDTFKFACLRPPMVYGKQCTGNYQILRKFALSSPIFPDYRNKRSMIYIENLCEFVKEVIDFEREGLFFPQNVEYINTSRMVEIISQCHGKKIHFTKIFNWAIKMVPIDIVKKVFGDLTYEDVDTVGTCEFVESIKRTEGI